jgi:N-acetylmuramate 1-kinase
MHRCVILSEAKNPGRLCARALIKCYFRYNVYLLKSFTIIINKPDPENLYYCEVVILNSCLPIHDFISLFLNSKGLSIENFDINSIAGDGSIRIFNRIESVDTGERFIIMENKPSTEYLKKENMAYLMIGRHLLGKGLPMPKIYSYDLDNGWFILEDMGDIKLQNEVSQRDDSHGLLENVIHLLFKMQIEGAEGFKKEWCCQTEKYDQFVMRRYESDYFRDSFLSNYLGIKSNWPELEGPFDHISQIASTAGCNYFMHRDFQSRNLMICYNKTGILDWQGSRLGPLGYDLASFLIDPYINIPWDEKKQLYGHYVSLLKQHDASVIEFFEVSYPYLAIQRNLQILGAFGYLVKVRGKMYFKEYIPSALKSLDQLLDEVADQKLSSLTRLVHNLALEYFSEPIKS